MGSSFFLFVVAVVFDVYISSDDENVYLIDFNPFGEVTDSLLFAWEDLYEIRRLKYGEEGECDSRVGSRHEGLPWDSRDASPSPDCIDFRVVRSQLEMSASTTLMYQFPKDLYDFEMACNTQMEAAVESLIHQAQRNDSNGQ